MHITTWGFQVTHGMFAGVAQEEGGAVLCMQFIQSA